MAQQYRDQLAKTIYGRLFSYLVNCINDYLQGNDDNVWWGCHHCWCQRLCGHEKPGKVMKIANCKWIYQVQVIEKVSDKIASSWEPAKGRLGTEMLFLGGFKNICFVRWHNVGVEKWCAYSVSVMKSGLCGHDIRPPNDPFHHHCAACMKSVCKMYSCRTWKWNCRVSSIHSLLLSHCGNCTARVKLTLGSKLLQSCYVTKWVVSIKTPPSTFLTACH